MGQQPTGVQEVGVGFEVEVAVVEDEVVLVVEGMGNSVETQAQ